MLPLCSPSVSNGDRRSVKSQPLILRGGRGGRASTRRKAPSFTGAARGAQRPPVAPMAGRLGAKGGPTQRGKDGRRRRCALRRGARGQRCARRGPAFAPCGRPRAGRAPTEAAPKASGQIKTGHRRADAATRRLYRRRRPPAVCGRSTERGRTARATTSGRQAARGRPGGAPADASSGGTARRHNCAAD